MSNVWPFRSPLLQPPSPSSLEFLKLQQSQHHGHGTNKNMMDLESTAFPALSIAPKTSILNSIRTSQNIIHQAPTIGGSHNSQEPLSHEISANPSQRILPLSHEISGNTSQPMSHLSHSHNKHQNCQNIVWPPSHSQNGTLLTSDSTVTTQHDPVQSHNLCANSIHNNIIYSNNGIPESLRHTSINSNDPSTPNVTGIHRERWKAVKRRLREARFGSPNRKKKRVDEEISNQMTDFHIAATSRSHFLGATHTDEGYDDDMGEDGDMCGLRLHIHSDLNENLTPSPVLPPQILQQIRKPCMELVLWKPVETIIDPSGVLSTYPDTKSNTTKDAAHDSNTDDDDLDLNIQETDMDLDL